MQNNLVRKVVSTKNFVSKHRVALAVAATTVVCYKTHLNVISDMTTFMAEKGVLEEFYALAE